MPSGQIVHKLTSMSKPEDAQRERGRKPQPRGWLGGLASQKRGAAGTRNSNSPPLLLKTAMHRTDDHKDTKAQRF